MHAVIISIEGKLYQNHRSDIDFDVFCWFSLLLGVSGQTTK